jgi:uncharacterized protein (TIGR02265 family)
MHSSIETAVPGTAQLAGLGPPDWDGDFDVEARLALIPTNARIKGMFWVDLQRLAAASPDLQLPGRYSPFKDYPLVDYMAALAQVARVTHPTATTREAIRRVGRRGFDVFATSLGGRVLFAFAGRDPVAALGLISEAYRRCLIPCDARVVSHKNGEALIELRQVWNFVETFQVGLFEGAIEHFGHTGSVKLRVHSPCDADYLLEWH